MTTDSYIETTGGGTMFSGADAVALFRATVICNAIQLYLNTGMRASRAYTPTAMAATAHGITGKGPYGRGRMGLERAMYDLQAWCVNAKAAIPVVDGNRVSLANMNPAAMAAALRNASKNT